MNGKKRLMVHHALLACNKRRKEIKELSLPASHLPYAQWLCENEQLLKIFLVEEFFPLA
jgi:hypothetical protein